MTIFDDLDAASVASTPFSTPTRSGGPVASLSLGKRMRSVDEDDVEELRTSTPVSSAVSLQTDLQPSRASNSLTFAKSLISGKRFKQSQVDAVERFAQATVDERLIMIYIALIGGQGQDDARAVELANWVPSKALETNLQTFGQLIVLSHKIRGYSTSVAAKLLWTLVKSLKWDIPAEVFTNPAATKRLDERVRYHLTQARSNLKKKLLASIASVDKNEHLHIYQLAESVCSGTRMNITIELCGRLAILRAEIELGKDKDFWMRVDARLNSLREKYKTNHPSSLAKAIRKILKNDEACHGPAVDLRAEIRDETVAETVLQVERTIVDSYKVLSVTDNPVPSSSGDVSTSAGGTGTMMAESSASEI
ncbi:hypothetical protein BKA93DRAFT_802459 [Sparassis latifolia]